MTNDICQLEWRRKFMMTKLATVKTKKNTLLKFQLLSVFTSV